MPLSIRAEHVVTQIGTYASARGKRITCVRIMDLNDDENVIAVCKPVCLNCSVLHWHCRRVCTIFLSHILRCAHWIQCFARVLLCVDWRSVQVRCTQIHVRLQHNSDIRWSADEKYNNFPKHVFFIATEPICTQTAIVNKFVKCTNINGIKERKTISAQCPQKKNDVDVECFGTCYVETACAACGVCACVLLSYTHTFDVSA